MSSAYMRIRGRLLTTTSASSSPSSRVLPLVVVVVVAVQTDRQTYRQRDRQTDILYCRHDGYRRPDVYKLSATHVLSVTCQSINQQDTCSNKHGVCQMSLYHNKVHVTTMSNAQGMDGLEASVYCNYKLQTVPAAATVPLCSSSSSLAPSAA